MNLSTDGAISLLPQVSPRSPWYVALASIIHWDIFFLLYFFHVTLSGESCEQIRSCFHRHQRVIRGSEGEASMGLRHCSCEVASHAGVHALYVWWRRTDI